MSSTLYLVSCVSRKLAGPAAAKDLYCSDWFRKARAYVVLTGGSWLILSAELGLVDPDTIICPYERTLNKLGVAERKIWAERVLEQLRPLLTRVDRVVFLAGIRYREFLLEDIRAMVETVEIPMEGLGIGQQLSWLKRELSQT